ncbi:MAG TPA: hypothetical protein VGC48_01675, partial [Gemmatimonadales bacterium]
MRPAIDLLEHSLVPQMHTIEGAHSYRRAMWQRRQRGGRTHVWLSTTVGWNHPSSARATATT